MSVTLGHNQYGKAETRVVRVYRDADPHEIVDYNVSVALSGDFEDIHLTGDNANCLTTDATKNTVNAFAKEHGEAARQPESFGIALAKHFVDDTEPVHRARIKLEMYPWNRLCTTAPRIRTRSPGTAGTCAPPPSPTTAADAVGGLRGDATTWCSRPPTRSSAATCRTATPPCSRPHDRVMATSVTAQWWHTDTDADWAQVLRLGAVATMSRRVRRPPQPGPAADHVRDGRGDDRASSRRSARCGSPCRTSTTSSST